MRGLRGHRHPRADRRRAGARWPPPTSSAACRRSTRPRCPPPGSGSTRSRRWTASPVRVRLTVPITFALKLPEMTRAEGIPELRQGAAPGFPPGQEGPARVVADVTLLARRLGGRSQRPQRRVALGRGPPARAPDLALRRRSRRAPRSASPCEADFVSPGRPGQPPRVELRARRPAPPRRGRRRPAAAPTPARRSGRRAAAPPRKRRRPPPPAVAPARAGAGRRCPPRSRSCRRRSAQAPPAAAPAAPSASPAPSTGPPAPPVEVITRPRRGSSAARPPPPPGFSAVRDVALAAGVPDLVKGRRPVVPPVARMARADGEVEVTFSVDAAGISAVQKVDGPRPPEGGGPAGGGVVGVPPHDRRAHLPARRSFTFQGDRARADVRRAE